MASELQVLSVSPVPSLSLSPTGLRKLYNASAPQHQVLHPKWSVPEESISRPSIKFIPDRADYEARTKQIQENLQPGAKIPEGFFEEITGPRTWDRKDIESVETFTIQLSGEEVNEIEGALKWFKDLPGPNGPEHMAKHFFPLQTLGKKLEERCQELHFGRGVTILRGLEPDKYSAEDNVLLFAGLSCYFGEKRACQDKFGNVLTHLVDMGPKWGRCSKRTPEFTDFALPYHNDSCDILCMYIQEYACTGGESTLASSAAVYNEIAATRPDVIKTLASDIWVYDKDTPPAAWPTRPILYPEPHHGPFFCFSRQKITGSTHFPLSPTLPAMTEEQAEALDIVHYTAEKHGITMTLKQGDMVFYNNLAVLHGRNAFQDAETGNRQRHILRLWVRNDELAWQTPKELATEWHVLYGDSERRAVAQWKMRPDDIDKGHVIGHKATCS